MKAKLTSDIPVHPQYILAILKGTTKMKITRRKFLKSGSSAAALAAGAVLLPQVVSGQISRNSGAGMLGGPDSFNAIASFSQADFERYIGTEFTLLSGEGSHKIASLTDVRGSSTGSAKNGTRTESFSLVFKGREWQEVKQDVYYVSHPELGYCHLLMAPVRTSRKDPRLCYEAVVNRLI